MRGRKRAFVADDGSARFTCPDCGREAELELKQQPRPGTPVRTRFRCPCGASHAVYVERRVAVRKPVEIDGHASHQGERSRHSIAIRDLSRFGLSFQLTPPWTLSVGDLLAVVFEVPGPRPYPVKRTATVRWIDGDAVGAEFTTLTGHRIYDREYDLALAFMPAAIES